MMASPPQVNAKVKRAVELIGELDVLCKQYLGSEDFHIVKENVAPNKWDLVLRMNEAPPMLLGILVGDIVHNLRSSLDIAMFHYLREANFEDFSRLSEWSLSRIKFPIFNSENDFSDKKWHGGLAEPQLLLDLREVQPFRFLEFLENDSNPKNVIESSPLWQLHNLWNSDKHRGINLVVGGLDMLMLGLEPGQKSLWMPKDPPPWGDGSLIFSVEVQSDQEVPALNLSETFAIGLESDIEPLKIYPVVSKLQALLGKTEHCHWILKSWFDHRL
jgi:hypothetical protein